MNSVKTKLDTALMLATAKYICTDFNLSTKIAITVWPGVAILSFLEPQQ